MCPGTPLDEPLLLPPSSPWIPSKVSFLDAAQPVWVKAFQKKHCQKCSMESFTKPIAARWRLCLKEQSSHQQHPLGNLLARQALTFALHTAVSLGRDGNKAGSAPHQGRKAVEEAVEDEGGEQVISVYFQGEEPAETQKRLGKHRGKAVAQIPVWLYGSHEFPHPVWVPGVREAVVSCACSHHTHCWLPLKSHNKRHHPKEVRPPTMS